MNPNVEGTCTQKTHLHGKLHTIIYGFLSKNLLTNSFVCWIIKLSLFILLSVNSFDIVYENFKVMSMCQISYLQYLEK